MTSAVVDNRYFTHQVQINLRQRQQADLQDEARRQLERDEQNRRAQELYRTNIQQQRVAAHAHGESQRAQAIKQEGFRKAIEASRTREEALLKEAHAQSSQVNSGFDFPKAKATPRSEQKEIEAAESAPPPYKPPVIKPEAAAKAAKEEFAISPPVSFDETLAQQTEQTDILQAKLRGDVAHKPVALSPSPEPEKKRERWDKPEEHGKPSFAEPVSLSTEFGVLDPDPSQQLRREQAEVPTTATTSGTQADLGSLDIPTTTNIPTTATIEKAIVPPLASDEKVEMDEKIGVELPVADQVDSKLSELLDRTEPDIPDDSGLKHTTTRLNFPQPSEPVYRPVIPKERLTEEHIPTLGGITEPDPPARKRRFAKTFADPIPPQPIPPKRKEPER